MPTLTHYSDIVSDISFGVQYIWHTCIYIYILMYLYMYIYIIIYIYIYSDILCDIFSGIMAFCLTFFLACKRAQLHPQLHPKLGIGFGSRRAPRHPELARWLTTIETRCRDTLREEHTRSKGEKVGVGGRVGGKTRRRSREGVAPLLKSRGPHLAGGAKCILVQTVFFFITTVVV